MPDQSQFAQQDSEQYHNQQIPQRPSEQFGASSAYISQELAAKLRRRNQLNANKGLTCYESKPIESRATARHNSGRNSGGTAAVINSALEYGDGVSRKVTEFEFNTNGSNPGSTGSLSNSYSQLKTPTYSLPKRPQNLANPFAACMAVQSDVTDQDSLSINCTNPLRPDISDEYNIGQSVSQLSPSKVQRFQGSRSHIDVDYPQPMSNHSNSQGKLGGAGSNGRGGTTPIDARYWDELQGLSPLTNYPYNKDVRTELERLRDLENRNSISMSSLSNAPNQNRNTTLILQQQRQSQIQAQQDFQNVNDQISQTRNSISSDIPGSELPKNSPNNNGNHGIIINDARISHFQLQDKIQNQMSMDSFQDGFSTDVSLSNVHNHIVTKSTSGSSSSSCSSASSNLNYHDNGSKTNNQNSDSDQNLLNPDLNQIEIENHNDRSGRNTAVNINSNINSSDINNLNNLNAHRLGTPSYDSTTCFSHLPDEVMPEDIEFLNRNISNQNLSSNLNQIPIQFRQSQTQSHSKSTTHSSATMMTGAPSEQLPRLTGQNFEKTQTDANGAQQQLANQQSTLESYLMARRSGYSGPPPAGLDLSLIDIGNPYKNYNKSNKPRGCMARYASCDVSEMNISDAMCPTSGFFSGSGSEGPVVTNVVDRDKTAYINAIEDVKAGY